jgi:hypothetical protein
MTRRPRFLGILDDPRAPSQDHAVTDDWQISEAVRTQFFQLPVRWRSLPTDVDLETDARRARLKGAKRLEDNELVRYEGPAPWRLVYLVRDHRVVKIMRRHVDTAKTQRASCLDPSR